MNNKPITAVMVGAGLRGAFAYGPYAGQHPDEIQFVAVAEPDDSRREMFAAAHNIPAERQFRTWEEVMERPQMAQTLFNMTQDNMHYASSVAALEAGYDMLLEKPMTNSLAESVHLVQLAERHGRFLQICYVLRYTSTFAKIHEIIHSGRLGELITVEHRENAAYWHMAHSFVRGNWGNTAASCPMILAKCCHDLDILYWNLGCRVKKLQSFGSLKHYRAENAPPGATQRCTDGCPVGDDCPWDARRLYLDMSRTGWPIMALGADLSEAGRLHALETGPYGRCVYFSDNDVVDNQTINMEFENGATVVLFMHGHSHEEGRTMRYDGTRATLRAKFGEEDLIEIHDHLTNRCELVQIPPASSGHGGSDYGIMHNFVRAIRGEAEALTIARDSLESHLMAFAAEESRLNNSVIDMDEYRQRAEMLG